jgi:hypothetical protein
LPEFDLLAVRILVDVNVCDTHRVAYALWLWDSVREVFSAGDPEGLVWEIINGLVELEFSISRYPKMFG